MRDRSPFKPPEGAISLYIHVPFCERKCPYCAFESDVPCGGDIETWLCLLEKELKWWGSRIGRPVLKTCYIGGGTPTVLSPRHWALLAGVIDSYFDFEENAEVTVEANPNSMDAGHLLLWRDWRVTRVSIGVQSFDDAELVQLGRLHDSVQAHAAISSALASGFSVNADFMFGLPEQTFKNWAMILHEAVRSGVHHISLYQLSIESGTPWESMDTDRLSDGFAMYRWAQWYLPRKGFHQYEVANFSMPGHESRHNINYWREGEYLGAGPGASGYLGGWRYKNTGSLKKYGELIEGGKCAAVSGERLTKEAMAGEAAVLALRMTEGIDLIDYEGRFGVAAKNRIYEVLGDFSDDLYEITDKNVRLTAKGMRIANRIWMEFV